MERANVRIRKQTITVSHTAPLTPYLVCLSGVSDLV